ncbi:MAG: hypothetical protein ACQEP5_02820 [Actinomycetota bacterium]
MLIWTILIILAGCIIALVIYYRERNREAASEIKRLKQNIISAGYNFEQLEFSLEQIKRGIESLQKEENTGDIQTSAEKIKMQVEEVLKMLNSASRL